MSHQLKENLHHFFVGYTKNNRNMDAILKIHDWKEQAQKEIDRRKVEILKNLDIKELAAIANGDINLNEIIQGAHDSH